MGGAPGAFASAAQVRKEQQERCCGEDQSQRLERRAVRQKHICSCSGVKSRGDLAKVVFWDGEGACLRWRLLGALLASNGPSHVMAGAEVFTERWLAVQLFPYLQCRNRMTAIPLCDVRLTACALVRSPPLAKITPQTT